MSTPVTAPARAPEGTRRLLAATAGDLAAHLARSGPVPWRGRAGSLIEDVRAAGLTGRGGGAFPVWRKLSTVHGGREPVVVANAAEGEPLSSKDDTLLRRTPHLVLDGLHLAAEAVGSREAYLYVPDGPGRDAVEAALRERVARRWDPVPVTVVRAAEAFLAGEESAVVAAIDGRPALPRFRTEVVARSGVKGRPTLVQNAETLAHLAQLARYGPAWFRSVGTREEPGTFLATVSGPVASPGVYEVPLGIPMSALLAEAGGPVAELRAVLAGGYHGGWVPAAGVPDVPVSRAALARLGGTPGAGVIRPLAAGECGLRAAAGIVRYLAEQGARQCGPCLNGLPRLSATMTALAGGEPDPALPERLRALSALVDGRGACHHPDGVARFVRSTLATFQPDVVAHLRGSCVEERCLEERCVERRNR
jgi:NADH:ubiquinone oxidoreductase subunit F (NADH-binding)